MNIMRSDFNPNIRVTPRGPIHWSCRFRRLAMILGLVRALGMAALITVFVVGLAYLAVMLATR